MAATISSSVHSYDSTVIIKFWLIDFRIEIIIDPLLPSVIGWFPENSTVPSVVISY